MIALLGNLSRDLMEGEPRTGGAPFHAARALQQLDVPALIYARCAEADREELLPPLAALGTPVRYVPGRAPRASRSPTTATTGTWRWSRSATRGPRATCRRSRTR